MKTRSQIVLAFTLIALGAVAPESYHTLAPAQTGDETTARPGVVRLKVGDSAFVPVPCEVIAVSNERVLLAEVRNDRQGVRVTAVAPGESELRINGLDGKVEIVRYEVLMVNLDDELAELQSLLGDAGLITLVASRTTQNLIVKGEILTAGEHERYLRIRDRFPSVVDLVEVRIVSSDYQKALAELKDRLSSSISSQARIRAELLRADTATPTLLLKGTVYTDQSAKEVESLAQRYFPQVLNQITTEKPMIEINVIMATVDENKIRARGDNANIFEALLRGTLSGGLVTGTFTTSGSGSGSISPFNYSLMGGDLSAQVRAHKGDSLVTNYFEQFQSVESGNPAQFKDGGTQYFSIVSENVADIREIEVGVFVNITPEIQDNGNVRLDISLRNVVPSISPNSRNAILSTTESSQSTVIATEPQRTVIVSGIANNTVSRSGESTPLLEKIPVINLFFKSRERQNADRRTYLFVTPTFATVESSNRSAFSTSASEQRDWIENRSKLEEAGLGFWLGYDDDLKQNPPPVSK